MAAITLSSAGFVSGAAVGATPAPVVLNATFCTTAPFIVNPVVANQLWNFANNGAMVLVVYNTVAGANTFEPVLFPTTTGGLGAGATLSIPYTLSSMVFTMPSIIGSFTIGPFGPSKFNDTNGLCWINQVSAGVSTTWVGVMALPTAVT